MSKTQTGTLLYYLRELAAPGEGRDLTDRQLLERFALGDRAAFTLLIKRHGRLVWDVCRRTLGDEHDAEDAFQAVFLVLSCKAGSIHRADSLSSWLHGVALRTAMNAKRKATRRRMHEQRHAKSQSPTTAAGIGWQEAQTLLDDEIQRLTPAYRAVFVLCCMEGKSLADTARELGKSEGATAVALSRARKRLQKQLLERGLALGSVLAAVALTTTQASATIPAGLVSSTIQATAAGAGPQVVTTGVVSESVAALVKTMIKEMTHVSMMKLSLVAAAVVLTGAIAGGAAWYSASARDEKQPTNEPPAAKATSTGGRASGEKMVERIAWGKAVDGVQAGLEVAHEGRTCPLGESVRFQVWVRNVGDKPAKLTYHTDWFYTATPIVLGGDGKSVKAIMPTKPDARQLTFELTLKPGEDAPLGPPELAFDPVESKGTVRKPTVRGTAVAYKVRYEGFFLGHPALATGEAEILVQREGVVRKREKKTLIGNASRLAGATWHGKEEGGQGPTYHADGTGQNPDGSKFEWRVEGDYLIARKIPEEGKPEGWNYMPLLFCRDSKEYRLILDKEYSLFRVSPTTGKPDDKRTEEGRQFRRRWIPEEREGDLPALHPVTPPPNRDQAKPPRTEGSLRIGPNVQVSKANADILHAEVVLAADPTDSRRLAAASMYQPPPVDPAAPKIIVYRSTDGGSTWTPTLKRTDANPASLADPAFAWGASDSLFFVNMWTPSLDKLADAGCLQIVRSQDGGRTWGQTTTIKEFHDRPFLAMDSTGGKYQGRLYCLTHKGLLVSADSGRSFGSPRTWTRRSGFIAYASCNPVVLSDGTLVAVYNSSRERTTAEQKQSDPTQDARYLAARVSRDGGDSFAAECVIAEYRGNGYAQAAAAPAHTAWKDRIYLVWQENLPRGRTCISFACSKDGGKTFSKPFILSEQSQDEGDDAFVPSIAVNKAGIVAVMWYDTRGLRPGEAGWDIRLRASLDGGETWQQSVQVSDAPTRKDKKTRKRLAGVGHTAGLAADADGVFHCLWVDGRSGVSQVYTAAVTVAAEKKP